MASFDEIKEQAGNVANMAKDKALEFAEAAGEWAEKDRPEIDKAFESAGEAAKGAVDKVADGASIIYEAIKNKAEEASGMDVDGDGVIGGTGAAPGEVEAGVKVVADAAVGAAGAVVGAAKGIIGKIANSAAEAGAEEAVAEAEKEAAEEAAEAVTGWRSGTIR